MAFNIENKNVIRIKGIEAELVGKHIPISHRLREPVKNSIAAALENNTELSKTQQYMMTQIILHFLENF